MLTVPADPRELDALLAAVDELDGEACDGFPWDDAARWSPSTDPVPVLSARLDDGRYARWSAVDGWSGDADMVNAAKAVGALFSGMDEMTCAARGLLGAAVDGWADEPCWLAARL